jgi:hypothetical protein
MTLICTVGGPSLKKLSDVWVLFELVIFCSFLLSLYYIYYSLEFLILESIISSTSLIKTPPKAVLYTVEV